MIIFGMSNTLISFRDKFFEYGGDEIEDKRGLTIGGYESARLEDLVASYILEKTNKMFVETRYHGIYRDYGFIVFESIKQRKI